MLMKYEFQKTCTVLGLEDHELTLAELVWTKCERAMQGHTTQTPSLLTKQPVALQRKQPEELFTREEMQFLKNLFSQVLTQGEQVKRHISTSANALWQECDKDNPETASSFEQLNNVRMLQRKVRTQMNKVAKIQGKIKRKLSE